MMRDHAAWIVGAFVLALAAEGWKGVLVETVGHGAFITPAVVLGATAIGWAYSRFVEVEKKGKKSPPKPKTSAKRQSKH